jgi:hypothetical protein
MSMHTQGDQQVVACDHCGHREYSEGVTIMDFLEHLRSQGWKMRREGDEYLDWTHTCPDCLQDHPKR